MSQSMPMEPEDLERLIRQMDESEARAETRHRALMEEHEHLREHSEVRHLALMEEHKQVRERAEARHRQLSRSIARVTRG